MSNFGERLAEARKLLGLSQDEFGQLGGVSKFSQLAYEKGSRKPDTAYLEALVSHGVDVGYLLTGVRVSAVSTAEQAKSKDGDLREAAAVVVRELTPEEAALLDNYKNADESGRAAARRVLDALAEQKKKRAA